MCSSDGAYTIAGPVPFPPWPRRVSSRCRCSAPAIRRPPTCALDFLAEFTQHIPPQGAHLIRYYGWYSNKARGMRRKDAEAAAEQWAGSSSGETAAVPARSRASQTWAMLIKRVYEIDPLACPECGGQMKVVAFIEPPQGDVIENILRHCGLWCPSSPRAPPTEDSWVHDPDGDSAASDEPRELTYVDIDTFEATF